MGLPLHRLKANGTEISTAATSNCSVRPKIYLCTTSINTISTTHFYFSSSSLPHLPSHHRHHYHHHFFRLLQHPFASCPPFSHPFIHLLYFPSLPFIFTPSPSLNFAFLFTSFHSTNSLPFTLPPSPYPPTFLSTHGPPRLEVVRGCQQLYRGTGSNVNTSGDPKPSTISPGGEKGYERVGTQVRGRMDKQD